MGGARWLTGLVTSLGLLALPASAFAAAGDLDPSFSRDGILRIDDGAAAGASKLATDGREIAVGITQMASGVPSAVHRLDQAGRAVAGFGDGGRVQLRAGRAAISALEFLGDGSLLVATDLDGSRVPEVLRLGPDGAEEPSFGSGGRLALPAEWLPAVLAVAADRSTFYLGTHSGEVRAFGLDGEPVQGFGDQGVASFDRPVRALAPLDDGKLLVLSSKDVNTVNYRVTRLTGGGGDAYVVAVESGSGPPDADGDGVRDRADDCDGGFAPRRADGCPRYRREISFVRGVGGGFGVSGRVLTYVSGESPYCSRGRVVVKVDRENRPDLVIGVTRSKFATNKPPLGNAKLRIPRRFDGKRLPLYARVRPWLGRTKGVYSPRPGLAVGRCLPTKTPVRIARPGSG